MEVKKILWPTDLSPNAQAALPCVQSLGEKYKTEVHLLYVIEDLGGHAPWYGEFDKSHINEIHDWEKKKAAERLDEICSKYLEGCPLFVKHTTTGDPAEEILKLAEDLHVGMIVMAASGRRGRFGFGSVTDKVVKNSPVPVVVIPAGR
ncbi:MAG: universal stress protein [Deltaproteobacteria bacterium]|nr:universal stress protein [Deltaproteobacteria bacterium]